MTEPWIIPADEFAQIADELERPAQIVEPLLDLARRVNPSPAQRRSWFDNNFETWTPTDPDERDAYLAELANEAANGPRAGQETTP